MTRKKINGNAKESRQSKSETGGEAIRQKVDQEARQEIHQENREASGKKAATKGGGDERPAAPVVEAMGRSGPRARRRAHPRLHARAIGTDLHAAFGLYGRRRDQGGTARYGRHHARPAPRREGRRQPVF